VQRCSGAVGTGEVQQVQQEQKSVSERNFELELELETEVDGRTLLFLEQASPWLAWRVCVPESSERFWNAFKGKFPGAAGPC
jgi:hypothetical protein